MVCRACVCWVSRNHGWGDCRVILRVRDRKGCEQDHACRHESADDWAISTRWILGASGPVSALSSNSGSAPATNAVAIGCA